MIFADLDNINGAWQEFERLVCRYLLHKGYEGVRIVGASGDKGADVIAHRNGKRWLFQVKRWARPVGALVVEETVRALSFYGASIPVIVSRGGFDQFAYQARDRFRLQQVFCQLWDSDYLIKQSKQIIPESYPANSQDYHKTREYQERAICLLNDEFNGDYNNKAMIVMATGLGKTRVMCEFVRRACDKTNSLKILILAHTNDLVYQLERSFWHHLRANQKTAVWNGIEKTLHERIEQSECVFACLNTVALHVSNGGVLPDFDIILVDECHHVGDQGMYRGILDSVSAGEHGGAFLAGATATPWRPDEYDLGKTFGKPLISIDLVAGLKRGFLSNVDYRMFTTNLDWKKFSGSKIKKNKITPKGINRTIFISEWDDGVIGEIEQVWNEQDTPRAIIFCGTIDHAKMMRNKINARKFCRAEAVFSGGKGAERQAIYERNRIISDFQVGKVNVMCCVDIFNEGIDVPDVNIVVFQRVTHSRRIFVQQLGRGLRIAPGKKKVIVLDFVSDVRRFAAGIELKDAIKNMPIKLNHKIEFYRHGERDNRAESFLREWLEDIAKVEAMGENTAELKYPPPIEP